MFVVVAVVDVVDVEVMRIGKGHASYISPQGQKMFLELTFFLSFKVALEGDDCLQDSVVVNKG